MPDFAAGAWSSANPIPADAWKRAVYRRPPNLFHVKLLPPEKFGNGYSYGFRIHPIQDDSASITTRTTTTSSSRSLGSSDEYDIWRKWEDCLYFQDALEVEYTRAAREKRSRLAAGKGVKKNGVYIHSDQAASWESLPFGPNPNDIARDIHEYIPKLSKKGTLFRASQETIDQRYEELQKMMYALLQEDLPTLIREIKATLTFTDFFGVWRRDVDLARKSVSPKKHPADRSRPSLHSTILSPSPVSFSSFSAKSSSQTKGKAPEKPQVPFGISLHSDSSCSDDSVDPPRPSRLVDRRQDDRSMRSRGSSSDSYSSSSLPSTPVTMSRQLPPTSRPPVIASQESSIRFDHNPHALGGDRRSSFLESLPEDRELPSSPKSVPDEAYSRKRVGSAASNTNRNARFYVPSPGSLQSSESTSRSLSRHPRASLQSTTSLRATAYLDVLDVDYCLPSPVPEPRCGARASISSMASVMSNSSVDAVIPRSERPSKSNNEQRPRLYPEEPRERQELLSEDGSQSEDQGDILDDYFSDLIRPRAPTPDGFPETPTTDETTSHFSHAQSSSTPTLSSFSRFSDRRSSLATSISSSSTVSSGNPIALSVKAMHEDNIVVLRLPRYISFDDLRRKIYDKFLQTNRSTICESFAIALLEQPTAGAEREGSERPRAGSLPSLESTHAKCVALHFISSQDEWDDVVATHGSKMLLRIIGSRE